jgi:fatty acid desaturase
VALTYFFVSAYFQSEPIQRYIRRAKLTNRHLYGRIMVQYGLWITYLVGTLALALVLYPLFTGLGIWFLVTFVPAFSSLFLIMFFNYIQHVHADAWSDFDHSRNFTGGIFNYLFFNNGYHTAHHNQPGLHWSALPAAHAKIAGSIAPQLNETNLVWYLIRQYLLAALVPRYSTQQLGSHPAEFELAPASVVAAPKTVVVQHELAGCAKGASP